jgi:hypothetical protein
MPRRFVLGLLLGGLVGRQGHDEGVADGVRGVDGLGAPAGEVDLVSSQSNRRQRSRIGRAGSDVSKDGRTELILGTMRRFIIASHRADTLKLFKGAFFGHPSLLPPPHQDPNHQRDHSDTERDEAEVAGHSSSLGTATNS